MCFLIGANCGHKQKSMKPLAPFDWAPPAKPNQIVVIFSCNLEKESLKQADTGRVNSTRLHNSVHDHFLYGTSLWAPLFLPHSGASNLNPVKIWRWK
jgi:hypothetical protein